MRTKTLFYALLAMVIVGVATSCKKEEEAIELPKPEVKIVKNEVEDVAANFVSYTITVKNASEAYWYLGNAIDGPDYVVEHGTRFTSESVVVEESLSWNNTKCLWAVAISADGQKVMDGVEIIIGEEPTPEMTFLADYGVGGIYYSINQLYDITFYFGDGIAEPRQLCVFLYFDEETNGVVPEGRYVLGAETLPNIGNGTTIRTMGGTLIANLVSATLDVEHIGNEYHFVLNAEDSDGAIYNADWTGKIRSSSSEDPIYNPGEAPEPEPEKEIVMVTGECYERGYFAINMHYTIGTLTYDLSLVLVGDTDGLVVPEGVYTYSPDYDLSKMPFIRGDASFHFYYEEENVRVSVVDATVAVEHIDNQYHFDVYAVDERGAVVEIDWTGQLDELQSEYPVYNPGEESASEMTFLADYGVGGIYYSINQLYDITFYFGDGIAEPRQLCTFLYFDEETNGVVPEGRYVLGAETLPNIGNGTTIRTMGGTLIANLVSATLDVEHIGNEYHFVLNAEDSDGAIYNADWTGKIRSSSSEDPIYNPGEVPTE